jgi:CRISPR type I-A-associated protein Csa5
LARYDSIVNVLRVFAKTGNYAPIDRIANALTPRAVENALYDGLRLINTLIRQAEEITVNGRKIRVIDYAKVEERKARGFTLAKKGKVKTEEGEISIKYVEVPESLPREDEIRWFLNDVRKGFAGLSVAREVAMRALTPDP